MASAVFLSRIQNPCLIMRRTPGKPKLRESLQNTGQILLKIVKVIKNKKSLKKHHSLEKHKEIMMVKRYVVSWMESRNRKRASEKERLMISEHCVKFS